MNLEQDFTLSEEELEVVREAIRKTMAEFLAKQKWLDGVVLSYAW